MAQQNLNRLTREVRACTICERHLAAGVRPVFQVHPDARILIAGQAPGRRVHESGVPFDDPSGDRLRDWMGVSTDVFYDAKKIAILPMGFCYPGTGKSGDLPPRRECIDAWREQLLAKLTRVKLVLAIGQYAIAWHLERPKKTLTETVRAWRDELPTCLPMPHPSPRNNIWLSKNPWFDVELLPYLRRRVRRLMSRE